MPRVLVVSDYPVMRAGLRAVVEASGELEVIGQAGTGDALARVAELRPDVALLDAVDDEQETVELVYRLSAELPEVGVVVLSRDPSDVRARQALQAGARGYLLRDVSAEEVSAALLAADQGLTVLHPAVAEAVFGRPQPHLPAGAAEPLTPRELEVLALLAQGLPSKTIANRLHISEHTVKFHVGSILGKLGAASRTEAVTLAIRRGLIAL